MIAEPTGAENEPDLSGRERRAIQVLTALASQWPSTLKLIATDGRVSVTRTHDSRSEPVLATVNIPFDT